MRIPDKISAGPVLSLALALALAACSQEDAPSETIRNAADSVVEQVEGSQPAKLAEGPYAPRDDCGDTPGAASFRKQLSEAIAARDADRLAALAAPDVKLDFGGGSGTGKLRERLTGAHDLWDELAQIVELGCGVNAQGGITMPWYASQKLASLDPANAMLVTGEEVPLRADASIDAAEAAILSWDFVTLVDGLQPEDKYQKVRTADGTVGFIATDRLRSPLDYRLTASSRDGKWSFTSLIAGD